MIGKRRIRRARTVEAQLDITAFLNLMVALVPFLLVSAVFTQISIFELNLPSGANAGGGDEDKRKLALEIVVRAEQIEIADRNAGVLKRFTRAGDGFDYRAVGEKLREVKTSFPNATDVTILLEPEIPYDTIIQVMDTARTYETEANGRRVRAELFPAVSIGDAPPARGK